MVEVRRSGNGQVVTFKEWFLDDGKPIKVPADVRFCPEMGTRRCSQGGRGGRWANNQSAVVEARYEFLLRNRDRLRLS